VAWVDGKSIIKPVDDVVWQVHPLSEITFDDRCPYFQ
jgi:hypothetical protein